MFKCNLRHLMAGTDLYFINDCMEFTGLGYPTISKLYHNERLDTIKLSTLQVVCDCFHCNLSDLIEYIPDSHKS